MSSIPSNSEIPNESGDASGTTIETPTMQNKIADILLKLSMREDSMAAGEAVTPALQSEIHTCIMRLLNSGRFSVRLVFNLASRLFSLTSMIRLIGNHFKSFPTCGTLSSRD